MSVSIRGGLGDMREGWGEWSGLDAGDGVSGAGDRMNRRWMMRLEFEIGVGFRSGGAIGEIGAGFGMR